tara:strand:- start:111 stop:314 length:204 start_codon:yes stop_codon:yes gene_type:complete
LKLVRQRDITKRYKVAPITGAWIETYSQDLFFETLAVAPITGAWIETRMDWKRSGAESSRAHHGRVD